MWRTERAQPHCPPFVDCASNFLFGARILGRLDVAAFGQSYRVLLERHDTLRSTVGEIDGWPCRIRPPDGAELPYTFVDMRPCHPDDAVPAVSHVLEHEVGKEIDPIAGPLCRSLLIAVSDDEHVFACVVHQLAFDGDSKAIFARELKSLYGGGSQVWRREARTRGVQHVDYVRWERSEFSDDRIHAPAAAMAARLNKARRDADPDLHSAVAEAARRTIDIDRERTECLIVVGRVHGVTLAILLLTIFVTALSRVTGLKDLLVGVPVLDRKRPEFRGLIGFFVDVVVVHCQGGAEQRLEDAVLHVRKRFSEAFRAQQRVPYGRFLLWARDHGVRVPHYPFVFSFHNDVSGAAIELPGLQTEDLGVVGSRQQALADAGLLITSRKGALRCVLSTKASGTVADRVEQFCDEFERIVSLLVRQNAQTRDGDGV